jgi:putative hydrolase of the HAD superfamily
VPLLLCDLDDTLLDRVAIFRAWANEFASSQQMDQDLVDWLIAEDEAGYRPRADLWALVKDRLSLEGSVEDLVSSFQDQFVHFMRCEDSVVGALVEAREAGWAIAIVTNGDAFQHHKVAHANLSPLVDAVCVSGVEGWRKPDPRIFELAAERCGVALSTSWMIGDNPETDVGGAVACGIRSIWLPCGRDWPGDLGFRPTHTANSFAEAVGHVLGADARR